MTDVSEYEKIRLRNLQDNKRILAELGLWNNPFKPSRPIKKAPKRKRESLPARKKFIVTTGEDAEDYNKALGSVLEPGERRRSSRIKGLPAPDKAEITDEMEKAMEDDGDAEYKAKKASLSDRPMVYGAIPGVEVGTLWQMRIECNRAGIHRPTVAGIHAGPEGAYSIALSGGYEDDIDLGECFTYTGEGGRDLKGTSSQPKNLRTAPQSKDQPLSKGNLGLVRSAETNRPVRVIRGYKSRSEYAPEDGYRYDGLYNVEKHWYTTGLSGFAVYKFALTRLKDQAPPPWTYKDEPSDEPSKENKESEPDKEEVKEPEKEDMPVEEENPDIQSEPESEKDESMDEEHAESEVSSDKDENCDPEKQMDIPEEEKFTSIKEVKNMDSEVTSAKTMKESNNNTEVDMQE